AALATAKERSEAFYREEARGGFIRADESGLLGQLVRPLARVGVYVPGGSAPLLSSLLMTVVPAKVAGVGEVIVASPP
ncbi:histidinol dehydrogenase, partial [Shewanella sp. C31]|nr:histidinol dehydrogenase [Shewanella electrica]